MSSKSPGQTAKAAVQLLYNLAYSYFWFHKGEQPQIEARGQYKSTYQAGYPVRNQKASQYEQGYRTKADGQTAKQGLYILRSKSNILIVLSFSILVGKSHNPLAIS